MLARAQLRFQYLGGSACRGARAKCGETRVLLAPLAPIFTAGLACQFFIFIRLVSRGASQNCNAPSAYLSATLHDMRQIREREML